MGDQKSDPMEVDAVVEGLHAVIPHTRREGRSEALERRPKRVVTRKQEHLDALIPTAPAT